MSFLKITDPEKRDLIVKEFLDTKKNIQESQLRERAGKREFKKDLGKFFKPVTDVQKSAAEEIKEELKPLKEIVPVIEGIPGFQTIHNIHQQALPGPEEKDLNTDILNFGPIASKYIKKLGSKSGTDKTFGIYMIKIEGDNITVGDKEYEGTQGLWELIIEKDPDQNIFNLDDLGNYGELLFNSNAIYQKNNPNSNKPKASGGRKWTKIVGPIWNYRDEFKRIEGSGFSKDPNSLIERLDLLMESEKAGNTGVRNELISICDELKKQKILNANQHKIILKKC